MLDTVSHYTVRLETWNFNRRRGLSKYSCRIWIFKFYPDSSSSMPLKLLRVCKETPRPRKNIFTDKLLSLEEVILYKHIYNLLYFIQSSLSVCVGGREVSTRSVHTCTYPSVCDAYKIRLWWLRARDRTDPVADVSVARFMQLNYYWVCSFENKCQDITAIILAINSCVSLVNNVIGHGRTTRAQVLVRMLVLGAAIT